LWCEARGLQGAGSFLLSHVAEEIGHRDKLVSYMVESGAAVQLEAVPAPRSDFASLVEVLETATAHEALVSEQINDLARAALDENDFNTFNMLQWFIAEQREEMVLVRGIIDYINLAGFTGEGGDEMVNINLYLAELSKSPATPE
jgi:ferritin